MSDKTRVRYECIEGVAVLTLDEPPANCYSYELMQDLDAANEKRDAPDLPVVGEELSNVVSILLTTNEEDDPTSMAD